MHLYFLSDGSHSRSTLEQGKQQKTKNKKLQIKEPTAKSAGITQEVHVLLFGTCGSKITRKTSPGGFKIEPGGFKIKPQEFQNWARGSLGSDFGASWEAPWAKDWILQALGRVLGDQDGQLSSILEAHGFQNRGPIPKTSMLKSKWFLDSIFERFGPCFERVFGRFFEAKTHDNCKNMLLAKISKIVLPSRRNAHFQEIED